MKRYGEFVRTDVLYKHRPGVYGIIMDRDNILLTHQDLPDDEIQLPGGGIDPGEGAVQALHRECREETGWKVSIVRRLGAYQRFTYMSEYGFWAQKNLPYLSMPTCFKIARTIGTDAYDPLDNPCSGS